MKYVSTKKRKGGNTLYILTPNIYMQTILSPTSHSIYLHKEGFLDLKKILSITLR